MYGADVLIFEGILSFHIPEIAKLMDIKVVELTIRDSELTKYLLLDFCRHGFRYSACKEITT